MSYVLDALKKADIERHAGVFPSLAPAPTGRREAVKPAARMGVGIVAGVGMLLAGFALGAWHPWQTAAGNRGNPVAAAPIQVATVAPAAPQPVRPVPDLASAPMKSVRPPATGAEGDGKPPARRSVAAPSAVDGGRSSLVRPVKPVQPQALPGVTQAAGRRILAYGDLPADIQRTVPRISFGGYAGMGEADERVGFINDRLIREGDEVSPGLRLERVGEDGAVLSYGGYRFRP